MQTKKWTLMLIGFVAIVLAGGNAWADGKRGKRDHGGKGYHAGQHHKGGGSYHKKPHHGGHYGYHHKKPHHHGYGYDHRPQRRPHDHGYYKRPYHGHKHPGYGHRPHKRPHHYRYQDTGGGYLFSAAIIDPGFFLGFATGERW